MTQDQMEVYVSKLDQELQDIYHWVYQIVRDDSDTSGDDFQVACQLLDVFDKWADSRLSWEKM